MEKITAVNGQVLRWARESSNLPVAVVSDSIGRSEQNILEWEEGNDYPTYSQIEKLSKLYCKPIAVFFFPEAPQVKVTQASFRSLSESAYHALSYKIIHQINKARVMQLNLYELNDSINTSIVSLTNADLSTEEVSLANQLRILMDYPIENQKKNRSISDMFEVWRHRLHKCGIYVFKDAFDDSSVSGFCLYDDVFPVIYVNNSMSFTRQIFTLFHEMYHIVSRVSGIDKVTDDYFNQLNENQLSVEVRCNRFAGQFLVPLQDLKKEIKGEKITDNLYQRLASTYKVSREVIARRLLDSGIISQQAYENKREEYSIDAQRSASSNGGGNYYNTHISYLGNAYLHLAFSCFDRQRISVTQLADYTRVKVENLPKLKETWGWRMN